MRTALCIALVAFAALAQARLGLSGLRTPLYNRFDAPPGWQLKPDSELVAYATQFRGGVVRIPISVALVPNAAAYAQLDERFWAATDPKSGDYQNWMTPEELHELLRPSDETLAPIRRWLHGIEYDVVGGDVVYFKATKPELEKLFATTMRLYEHIETGMLVLRSFGETSLPADVAAVVELVADLHDFPHPKKNKYFLDSPVGGHTVGAPSAISYVSPQTLYSLYNITDNTVHNKATSAGIYCAISGGGVATQADLSQYDTYVGLPEQTFTLNGDYDPNTGLEATLDVQMMTTVSLSSNTTLFVGTAWMFGFATYMNSLGNGAPWVISISYDWSETGQCDVPGQTTNECSQNGFSNTQYILATERQWQKLGMTGHSIFVSSGDLGAPGDANPICSLDNTDSPMNPMYSGSSAFVTSVGASSFEDVGGGLLFAQRVAQHVPADAVRVDTSSQMCTQLNCSVAPFGHEVPAHLANSQFTSGCGFSNYISQPTYQQSAVSGYLSSKAWRTHRYFNSSGRAYPDIAALGQNGVIIGEATVLKVGGTSMATPIIASMFNLINDALFAVGGKPVGFVTPLLYSMFTDYPDAFHKVTAGTCRCTEACCSKYGFGSDPAGGYAPAGAGLGTLNFGLVRDYIVQQHLAREAAKAAKLSAN